MGELFLDQALALLSSDKVKERTDGLADLKHILLQNKKSSKLSNLNDKASHRILNSLFQCVSIEKLAFSKAQRSTSKSAVTSSNSRLSTCASVLRIAVDALLHSLRIRSVRAIIEHVTETISVTGEGLWEPLSLDYTKCLTSLLRYSPHTEHLGSAEWDKLIDFCLAIMKSRENEESQVSSRSLYRDAIDDTVEASDSHSNPSRTTPAPVSRDKSAGDRSVIGEAVECIQLLTASSSAHLQASAGKILNGLVEFVKSQSTMAGNLHQLAFSSINTVVAKVLFDQSQLAQSTLLGLVPIIRRLWTSKLQSLKDELLVCVMLCIVVLNQAAQNDPLESLGHLTAGLASSLYSEYVKRPEKELLQIDETVFWKTSESKCKTIYGPRLGNSRSENSWTVIWAIGMLLKLSDSITLCISSQDPANELPHKRQRFNSEIGDLLRDATAATGSRRISSLQLVPFLENQINSEEKEAMVLRLLPHILDDDPAVSSWTMIALASIACNFPAKCPSPSDCWVRAVVLATRVFSSSLASRAACKLVCVVLEGELLDYSTATETMQSILSSASLSGPSILSDASLELWAFIARRKTQLSPKSAQNCPKQICSWLREVWTIGTFTDRLQTAQIAMFARPLELLDLFLACTNQPFRAPRLQQVSPMGPIARTWFLFHQNQKLLDYFFDMETSFGCSDIWLSNEPWSLELSTQNEVDDSIIVELLRSKSELFLQAWKAIAEDKSYHVTADGLQTLSSFCISSALYGACLPQQSKSRMNDLQLNCKMLWESICRYLMSDGLNMVQPCLEVLWPLIPSSIPETDSVVWSGLSPLVLPLATVLEKYRQDLRGVSLMQGDLMDLDDQLTLGHQQSNDKAILASNRDSTSLFPNSITLQRCATLHLSILVCAESRESLSRPNNCSSLVEYLTTLHEADIVSAQSILPNAYQFCAIMHKGERGEILRVLEDVGEKCLQSYELERCESSHIICIRMMTAFANAWTATQRDTLSDSAMDLYSWFIEVLLSRKRASPKVFVALSELFEAVLDVSHQYGTQDSLPSPRTNLFKILQEGDVGVKFKVAEFIPQLFQRFSFKDHDAIFDDVLESLPRDPDWTEGIAIRLAVLSQLASRWHTLLRRSIYHLFETAAHVPSSSKYAEKCMKHVSEALGLGDARQLFQLFAPQIIYTWTETQSIASMPFSIFGYRSLRDMVVDVKDEIFGQMMMRAKESEMVELASQLGLPYGELLKAAFYKAEAYCVARDISTPPGQGSQPNGVEIRLRKVLGADGFMAQIESHFPEIIATFFKSLDYYDQIERAFSKRPNFRYALDIQSMIADKIGSLSSLPANQQPSFRARYLLDELEILCKRAGFELESIWTPTLVSFVCRSLLESIHPALGSLHTCSVLRKIKILVCLAGPVMLQDYPFQMLLHALRPYLSDALCFQDALGIFWYLLEAGEPYLLRSPGLVAGTWACTFVTLRKMFSLSAEVVSQEDQSDTCVTARKFQTWLSNRAAGCSSPDWSPDVRRNFAQMLHLSQQLSERKGLPNNAGERDLVFEVLRDRQREYPLLDRQTGDLLLSLLCPQFRQPSFHDRCDYNTVDDTDTTAYVAPLCRTLQKFDSGSGYRLWAARIIGRSFADTGKIDQSLLREHDVSLFETPRLSEKHDTHCYSKASIIQVLCDQLPMHNHSEAGLVERTLQLISYNIANDSGYKECAEVIPESLMKALIWTPYACPAIPPLTSEIEHWDQISHDISGLTLAEWARNTALFLSNAASGDPVIGSLSRCLHDIPELAAQLLPYVIHDVLLSKEGQQRSIRSAISNAFKDIMKEVREETIPHARLVISCILYLRNQSVPGESTVVDRDKWLDIDYAEASVAANICGLHKISLLFLEIEASRVISGSRRSSVARYEPPSEFLHDVFKSIDDPDLFYGIQQNSSLATVMERLEYESSGFKNLLFQSAHYDSQIQLSANANPSGVLEALNSTNLQGIANTMLSVPTDANDPPVSYRNTLQGAASLQQWDVPVSPIDLSPQTMVFRAFQRLNASTTLSEVTDCVDDCLLTTLNSLVDSNQSAIQLRSTMRALGIMTEISDVLQSCTPTEIEKQWSTITARSSWLRKESYHEVREILSWHEALFSMIRKNDFLRSMSRSSHAELRLLEAKTFRQSLEIARNHGVPQASLKSAITLSNIAGFCADLGVTIDGAAQFDLAEVLWDHGEMTASIRMLQQLKGQSDLQRQAIPISRSNLLVTLGHHVAEARLEKPEFILQEYLSSAAKELKGSTESASAARVYHGFATFCDQQLQNPDGLEDFKRVEQLRDRKEKELIGLEDMMKRAEGKEKESLRIFRAKAKQWFDLDDREYQRLLRSREAFLQQCLENYLLALRESDVYNNDALRFCALWLDKADSKIANTAVAQHLNEVPTYKFAPLMNQLSSRLLDVSDDFQSLLTELVFRICVEHPFHGMYQIFASSKSKGGKDPSSHSRFRAANRLVDRLKNDKVMGSMWIAIHNMNITYVRFAVEKPDSKYKSGAKIPLKKFSTGQRLGQDAATYKLPPPTMKIQLRADRNYSRVPTVASFYPEFTIASGVSAPKILTSLATNGVRYKQLYKGGNDDLRQDAIMEQVFEQVSSLLKDHQPTRQRNLGIRTYKVLPLTLNAGIIEFVPNTIPLHDYLMPAHQRYFPKDMKPSVCRKHIADVQTRSFEQRVRTYRQVTEHFHPVMRYFFMEKFNNPDDWFSKRISYIRSTAAISILGHVLGLGDRHGHNILLDEKTGEVVHIDLGVAFEQGRILPVPEVVPFRLTRDLVDGFGITKTEGVFRRCCEFTLEALRQESYSIMTILDVLRYDPLYSWTLSPLRMKRMQDNQEAEGGLPVITGTAENPSTNEPSEADRALTVVAKKLGKTLSVTATVNELIQQATDEKNLAVLYCGWASYA